MSNSLPEAPAPDGIATRREVEAALRDRKAPVRFVGWNLADIDLTGLDFRQCEFVKCHGGRADFSSCDLTEVCFVSCDFNNARWRRASLASALFRDCKLTGAQIVDANTLGLTFENCLLVSALLRGLSFRRAELDDIDFQGADLTEADFRQAVLVRCNLREANVTDARFEGTDLRGADLGSLRLADAARFKGGDYLETAGGGASQWLRPQGCLKAPKPPFAEFQTETLLNRAPAGRRRRRDCVWAGLICAVLYRTPS